MSKVMKSAKSVPVEGCLWASENKIDLKKGGI